MDNRNVELDQLFASARNQVPEASFEETKKRFLGAVVLAAGGVLATKGIIHLFTKKWIIMMTIVSVATSATIVATTVTFGEPENHENNMVEPVSIHEEETPELLEEQPDEETYQVQMSQPVENEQAIVEEEEEPEIVIVEEVVCPDRDVVWHCPPDTTDKKKDKYKKKDKVRFIAYSERFVITQNTTEAELEEIKQRAEQAGINFSYTAEYKKGKLDHLNINMNLSYEKNDRTSSMSETRDITDINKNDEIIVAWVEDEDGQAMVIGDQNSWGCDFDYEFDTGEYMKDFERSMKEFEESMRDFEQMNFAFVSDSGCYVINMDCGNWANDFEIVIPEVPEIPMVDINMEMEELEEMLEDIDEMNEEILQEIEIKLQRLEERLQELEKELEEKHEQRERERRERDKEQEDQDREREKDE